MAYKDVKKFVSSVPQSNFAVMSQVKVSPNERETQLMTLSKHCLGFSSCFVSGF